jgi:hypothetical protein
MLFADAIPDPGPTFWTVFFASLPTLIAAIGACAVAIIAALKGKSNEVKIDQSIKQNEEIIKQGNGKLTEASAMAHDLGYRKGLKDAASASVETVAAAVAIGVAAAQKAEAYKPAT